MEDNFGPILERIKLIKKRMSFTNDELSLKSKIPKGTLSKILSGETKDPKITTLISLANAMNISVNYLAYGEENISDNNQLTLNFQEQEHIKKYRALDERGKKTVDNILDEQYEYVRPKVTDMKVM